MNVVHALLVAAFWLGLLVPILVYVAYPAAVIGLARVAHRREAPAARGAAATAGGADGAAGGAGVAAGAWPSVTVAIAAHNEERDIARAIRSALSQGYLGEIRVLVGLDGCTDGTRAAVESVRDPRVSWIEFARQGKAATANALVEAATTEVIVTNDAGAEYAPGTLQALAAPFRDPGVGCTTGKFAPRPDGTLATSGEGMYWRMEYALMHAESRLGILGAASGTCMAHRRSIYRPIPLDSDGDVAIAPNAALQGTRVVFVPTAIVHDDGPAKLEAVMRNRRRMALRALPTTITFIRRLLPRRPGVAFGLIMHKLLRWLVPFFAVLWAIAAIGLMALGDGTYTVLTAALVILGLLGTLAIVLAGSRLRGTAMGFAVAQVAFALAVIDMLRGRRARMWTRS